ncbi:RNA polymerase sigma factor [Haliangium sp.]|uniref:RNA polymerase sigma factor n=1 Tax=Haliangium sp. TaxID=2663208 RepID=UPI003D0A4ED5
MNRDDDAELLRRWRAGDNSAGKELFRSYYQPVARFFRNKVRGDVADLIQETFAACVAGRDRLRDDSSFRSYLFRVAYNTLNDYFRAAYRDRGAIDFADLSVQDLSPGPSSVIGRREEERLLLEGLRRLPIELQVLLELRFWESLKTIEIAEILGVPHATVRSRLGRAVERLEGEMKRLADAPDTFASTLQDLDGWARGCRDAMGLAP